MKKTIFLKALVAGALVLGAIPAANAEEGAQFPRVTDKVTKSECSACHMAYSAAMLPKRSWRAIVSDLSNHFGEDASLDAATTKHIRKWLEANAADTGGRAPVMLRGVAASETPLRISKLPVMVRVHKYEVSKRMRDRAGSMSNCNACHRGAENGYFEG